MTLQIHEYWYKRLDGLQEFGEKCRLLKASLDDVWSMLVKHPEEGTPGKPDYIPQDYVDLFVAIEKTKKQNDLNLLWIKQEIATREEMQDYPGAKNGT